MEVLRAVKVFAGDLYGSNLWKLSDGMAHQVYHAWDMCVKLAWQVPRGSHTYFVERLLNCGISHVKTDILSRYVNFFKSLRRSPSMEVSIMSHIVARDIRTTTGRNLYLIRDLTGLDPWCCSSEKVKKALGEKMVEVPEQDMWRIPYLERLLEERGEAHYQMGNTNELTGLIDSLCVN